MPDPLANSDHPPLAEARLDPSPEPLEAADPSSTAAVAEVEAPPPISASRAIVESVLCSSYPTQIVAAIALAAAGIRGQDADGALDTRFVLGIAVIDSLLVTALIVWFLHRRGESVRQLALGARPPLREILTGTALVPAVLLGVSLVIAAVRLVFPSTHNVPDNPLTAVLVEGRATLLLGGLVVVAGGVREELQRAFQLHRLTPRLLGPGMALALTSAAFGLGHTLQGYDVAVGTGVLGLLWGAMYLQRRSLVAGATCHALFNLGQVALAWAAHNGV